MSVCWVPRLHRYDGSCEGDPILPHYRTMPDRLDVYDAVVRVSGWSRFERKLWRACRTAALARWGLTARVAEPKDSPTAWYPHAVTLRLHGDTTSSGQNNYGGWGLLYPAEEPWSAEPANAAHEAEFGFVSMVRREARAAFLSRTKGRLTGVMCHEFGHALGFGHGGFGIMRSEVLAPYHPDTDELDALEDYWGLS